VFSRLFVSTAAKDNRRKEDGPPKGKERYWVGMKQEYDRGSTQVINCDKGEPESHQIWRRGRVLQTKARTAGSDRTGVLGGRGNPPLRRLQREGRKTWRRVSIWRDLGERKKKKRRKERWRGD